MGMGFAPTWLRQVSPPLASQNHFNLYTQLSRVVVPQKGMHSQKQLVILPREAIYTQLKELIKCTTTIGLLRLRPGSRCGS